MNKVNEAYCVLQDASGLKIGDTVRVHRLFNSNEMGYTGSGNDQESIGHTSKIKSEKEGCSHYGFLLAENAPSGMGWFPFYALEKINPTAIEVTMEEVCERFGHEVKIKKG